jgi:hypothetical protein
MTMWRKKWKGRDRKKIEGERRGEKVDLIAGLNERETLLEGR